MKESFLDKLADEILRHPRPDILTVIFPNRRPAFFLEEKLRERIQTPLIAPEIFSITDFFSRQTGLQPAEKYDLLLELYQAYASAMNKAGLTPQSFENFMGWGGALLRDFDETDKFLTNPEQLLDYLLRIKEIQNWSPGANEAPEMSEYMQFFRLLPSVYRNFRKRLEEQALAYDGMIYRKAAETMPRWLSRFDTGTILLAGFNALTRAEKEVFREMERRGIARAFWDKDTCYLQEPAEAGRFLRKIPFDKEENRRNWTFDACHPPSHFYVVHAPDDVSQVQFAADRLKTWEKQAPDSPEAFRRNTLVVLQDPALFYPFLHALPPELKEVNISYALPLPRMQTYMLVDKILRFYARTENMGNIDVLTFTEILRHPLLPLPAERTAPLIERLGKSPLRYYNPELFAEILAEEGLENDFSATADINSVLEILEKIIRLMTENIPDNNPEYQGALHLEKLIFRLQHMQNEFRIFDNVHALMKFFRRLAGELSVRFQGMPLKGYQIMGLLETRLLDFERVMILGANEGMLPPAAGNGSFIPLDVRKEYGLPLPEEKTAINAYHFYRLVSRAREVWLVYNAAPSGLHSGEASRYVWQLKQILPSRGIPVSDIYIRDNVRSLLQPSQIEKNETYRQILRDYLEKRGLSASMVLDYLQYPENFFLKYILGWKEKSYPEEKIRDFELGNVIHRVMQKLYEPYAAEKGNYTLLTSRDLEEMKKKLPDLSKQIFYEEYLKTANPPASFRLQGQNNLALEAAKKISEKFIRFDEKILRQGQELQILELEKKIIHRQEIPNIGRIRFKGFIDRIDRTRHSRRIIDYKTGKAYSSTVLKNVNSREALEKKLFPSPHSPNRHLFQLLFYLWLLSPEEPDKIQSNYEIIIYPARGKTPETFPLPANIYPLTEYFQEILFDILREMFDPEIPFTTRNPSL